MVISGGLAGLAGAFLAIEAAGIYRQGQTRAGASSAWPP